MKVNAFTSIPALPAAVTLGGGIAVGFFYLSSVGSSLLWWAMAFSIVLAIIFYYKLGLREFSYAIPAFCIGLFLGQNAIPSPLPLSLEDTYGTLKGEVVEVSQSLESTRAVVHVREWTPKNDSVSQAVDFKLLCVDPGTNQNIKIGSELTASGKILGLKNDFDVPYQNDYNRFLYIEGVVGRMTLYGSDNPEINNRNISSFANFLDNARESWLTSIAQAGFNEQTTCFLLAVIGGEDLLLSDDMEEQFRQSGLSHILAISGLHVAIILSILIILIYPIKLLRHFRPVYFIFLSLLIVFYALVTGGSPSACRASAMCCVLLGNRLFEVKANPLQSLAVAVTILLCLKPLWLFLPGFQLSVCAVLSIIAFAPVLDIVPQRHKMLRIAWALIILPVVALIGTLIPTIFYFHSFPVNFWLANIFAAIFVPLLIAIGFVGALLALIGMYCFPLVEAGNFIYTLMTGTIDKLSSLSLGGRIDVFLDTASLLVIGLIIITIIILVHHYNHTRAAITGVICLVGLWLIPFSDEAHPDSELYIPRYHDNTDVIIVHDGKCYLWTSAQRPIDVASALEECGARYPDFYRRRGVSSKLTVISESFELEDLSLKNNILTFNGKSIARIDNDSLLPTHRHVNMALISDRYRGNMEELLQKIDADSILLASSIQSSRAAKYERQLQSIDAKFRNLRDGGLVWQFP